MNRLIIPLRDASGANRAISGNKAAVLAEMLREGLRVPDGLCVTRHAYDLFITETGIGEKIVFELGRKRFEDMRWEEMWDTSLRIRNMFGSAMMPDSIKQKVLDELEGTLSGKPVAVRSSSLAEDSEGASFAGLHESFVNVSDPERIIESVKLVWASLWSDAALMYRNELSLDIASSAMAVVIQEMIIGEISGVGFCVAPNTRDQAVIESVFGLNQGLVDGDVEPDRYFIDRITGKIVSSVSANHERRADPAGNGFKIVEVEGTDEMSLNNAQVDEVYRTVRRLENHFETPQDVEWTFREDVLYVLQSRPVTVQDNSEKGWYRSLTRSFDNLQKLADRIENEILPQMGKEAEVMVRDDLASLPDNELAREIEKTKEVFDKWCEVYWEECIPFAHGVRLFATVYNDRIHPEDPYEFMEIILPGNMKSLERNTRIKKAGEYLTNNPSSIDEDGNIKDPQLREEIELIVEDFGSFTADAMTAGGQTGLIINLIRLIADGGKPLVRSDESVSTYKVKAFLASFPPEEKEYAEKLLEIASKSYRLRDDDNIYLGRVEANLIAAMNEARLRLSGRCDDAEACDDPEEMIKALRSPDYVPQIKKKRIIRKATETVSARQLRGQPAGKGIARGTARVILSAEDLFRVQRDEIIVCDAIDPTMTFIIPLVSAVVERRGGMLIHGAIIAREYGIACVTGIPQATEFIKTGDILTVDGYRGIVVNHTRTVRAA